MKELGVKQECYRGWTFLWQVRELKQGSDPHIWAIV